MIDDVIRAGYIGAEGSKTKKEKGCSVFYFIMAHYHGMAG